MEGQILSVSEFHSLLNQTLQYAYPEVVVQGEVSSYKVSQGKWVFFDLKDTESTISCFMPIYQLKTVLEDGMLVRVEAYPNLTKWGKFSLTVRAVELAGEGSVKKAFDALRAQFEQEGLFAPERKRVLPEYPGRIGLITSSGAAAYADFNKILDDRWAGLKIDHAQVQVQGVEAPTQIISAIEYFNQRAETYDALVIIRGGGSAEDLQAFNSEDLVRAVFASKLPTLVGIGHETDISLAEMVADVRAATPTDAARLLTPDKKSLSLSLGESIRLSGQLLMSQVAQLRAELGDIIQSYSRYLATLSQRVAELSVLASTRIDRILEISRVRISHLSELMKSLDPKAILQRGYAVVSVNGRTLRNPTLATDSDKLMIQLAEGSLTAKKVSNDAETDQQNRLF